MSYNFKGPGVLEARAGLVSVAFLFQAMAKGFVVRPGLRALIIHHWLSSLWPAAVLWRPQNASLVPGDLGVGWLPRAAVCPGNRQQYPWLGLNHAGC